MNKLKQYQMFINGEWVDSENKKTFETLNPENNEPWAIVPEASAKDVDKAVTAAQKAFEGEWPKLLPRERAKFLRAIGDQLRYTIYYHYLLELPFLVNHLFFFFEFQDAVLLQCIDVQLE